MAMKPISPFAGVEITLQKAAKAFSARGVFSALDLHLPAGSFTAVVGASGCGKTTLLRVIAGLEPLTGGRLEIAPAPNTAYVFQEAQLLPWRNVRQNVQLPLELSGVRRTEWGDRVDRSLVAVGMRGEELLYPSQLSGGMKMRVSLARALVTQPTLLLLDEPFAALDELTRVHLEEELRLLWQSSGTTVIFVTHSFSEAVFVSDRILMLSPTQSGLGDDLAIPLGTTRPQALRAETRFTELVLECRRRFERLAGAGVK